MEQINACIPHKETEATKHTIIEVADPVFLRHLDFYLTARPHATPTTSFSPPNEPPFWPPKVSALFAAVLVAIEFRFEEMGDRGEKRIEEVDFYSLLGVSRGVRFRDQPLALPDHLSLFFRLMPKPYKKHLGN